MNRRASGDRLARSRTRRGWRLGLAAEPGTSAPERLTIEVTLGLAQALERYSQARLRRCAASPCEEAFIDTSRNRSRRYCSERCANRHNVAAFRRRRRPRDAAPQTGPHGRPTA